MFEKCWDSPKSLDLENGKWGGKTYRAIFLGGERIVECALQNQLWRAQEVGLVWSVPVLSKENDRAWTKEGGEMYDR